MLWGNFFGFLAAIVYFLTIIPGIIRVLYPAWLKQKWARFLLTKRRETGLISFFFMVLHGSWFIWERQLNLLLPQTWISYFQGLSMGIIFLMLALTSNDWSVRNMKQNWKKLHNTTFLILIILPWHILDKMSPSKNGIGWSFWTFISLILSFFFVILTFLKLIQILKKK